MGYLANFMVYTLAMVGVIVVALLIFKSATSGGITGGKSVASGELVIINDRFGVRIEKVNDSSSESSNEPEEPAEVEAEEQAQSGDDFDYSDFEVEDGQESWL